MISDIAPSRTALYYSSFGITNGANTQDHIDPAPISLSQLQLSIPDLPSMHEFLERFSGVISAFRMVHVEDGLTHHLVLCVAQPICQGLVTLKNQRCLRVNGNKHVRGIVVQILVSLLTLL